MPEQTPGCQDIEKCLDFLEDYSLTTYQSRCVNYQKIQCLCYEQLVFSETLAQRLLEVCIHDLNEDMKYASITLAVIAQLLKKIKAKQCPMVPELVRSALAVLHIIKTTSLISKVQALQTLSFETFLAYPDETFIALVTNHCSEVIGLFNLYLHQGIPVFFRIMAFQTLHMFLSTLPPEKKTEFVKEGLNVWFSKVIPSTMTLLTSSQNLDVSITLEVLDILSAELQHLEYSDNPHWMVIMDCIYSPQKYPAVMKSLLESGDERWHQVWILFVKLLKQQITMIKPKLGSPINSMLPVVEAAFKVDVVNRCHAFRCWSVLVDNFSAEANENFVNKRIKLLIIPLRSNNAKVEETALAKFDTWWHMIRKFESRMQSHMDVIFVPFLQFCFGNPKHAIEKNVLVPGQLSLQLKKQSVQAIVESTGHIDCTGCTPDGFPKLLHGLLTPKALQDSLSQWLLSLKVVLKICGSADYSSDDGKKQISCIWKSVLSVVSRLQADVKKDVVAKLLAMVTALVEECPNERGTLDIVFDVVLRIFLEEPQSRRMLDTVRETTTEFSGHTLQILAIITNPVLANYYSSMETKLSVAKLAAFASAVLDDVLGPPQVSLELLLKYLPANDTGLLLWTAVMDTVCEIHLEMIADVSNKALIWPLKHMEHFRNMKYAALMWNKTYNLLRVKLQDTTIQNDMVAVLSKSNTALCKCDFSVFALLHVIKNNHDREYKNNLKLDFPVLTNVLAKQNFVDCDSKEEIFRLAVDSSALMLSRIGEVMDTAVAELALNLANSSLKILLRNKQIHGDDGCVIHAEKLLVQLKRILKIIENEQLRVIPIENLLATCEVLQRQSAKNLISECLRIYVIKSSDKASPLYKKVTVHLRKRDTPQSKDNFAAPETSAKKKKKEPSIINTVVENGEEYVVVKSNWKFNPKKLTENQKEKFQKKREDIPALYQDLSQSQEEFKLRSWKTASQDTSATSSNTTTSISKMGNNDAVVILQNMPSTEVVPKIMENIFSDNKTSDTKKPAANENINCDTKSPKPVKLLSVSAAKTKSPRIALKDRVIQNVKILTGKSSAPYESKVESKDLNKTLIESLPKTPVSKVTTEPTSVYSAPPKLSSERPSRVKRKPKKFETDFTELSLKRRRNSATVNDSQKDQDSEEMSDDPKCSPEVSTEDKFKSVKIDTALTLNTEDKTPERVVEPDKSELAEKPVNTTLDTDVTHCDFVEIQDSINKESQSHQDTKPSNSDSVKPGADNDVCEVISPETKEDSINNFVNVGPQEEPGLSQDVDIPSDVVTNKEKDSVKTKKPKKSRIESQLKIDMVEGHPLFTAKPEKITTKSVVGVICTRRNALKINKLPQSDSKLEIKSQKKPDRQKNKNNDVVKDLFCAKGSQENSSVSSNELPEIMSEDFIESSQDSTFTTISIKSSKKKPKILLENITGLIVGGKYSPEGKSVSDKSTDVLTTSPEKEDIEFSRNKSVEQENTSTTIQDLTEDFDTEPMDDNKVPSSDDDVIIITDSAEPIINPEEPSVSTQSQAIADADTQPNDSDFLSEMDKRAQQLQPVHSTENSEKDDYPIIIDSSDIPMDTQEVVELPTSTTRSVIEDHNESGISSPFKDEERRNKDFLNNTLEISPIKSQSPVQDDIKAPSPETNSDYVVVMLSSPVQCDGEPFEKSGSPEIFTEDKASPDKRDLSPPREEVRTNMGSPNSSLSLKKNKPQMRQGGRAAQMLGLCMPDRQNLINAAPENTAEIDEPKKTALTPARRNLRILYNCDTNDNNSEENEESENFLKFKKALPAADCSPSGPILKRKLIDMADDATISPASKRKRVSFHDPPVSTTMSVHKYIEPLGIRSPQSSLAKKQERQLRNSGLKSPKKLENIFKLDTALTKTVESFIDPNLSIQSEDITMSSLDQTPSVEIIKASDLNDSEPICPELIDCNDAISLIAAELSSPAMKSLLIKELEGHIQTIGDLAKLTELQVNRLCIKAPKVKIAKKVLSDYAAKQPKESQIVQPVEQSLESQTDKLSEMEVVVPGVDMEVQTDQVSLKEIEVQTDVPSVVTAHTQTKTTRTSSCMVQTNETGTKTTRDIVEECLKEKPDFVDELANQLDETSKTKILDDLPLTVINAVFSKKITDLADSTMIMDSALKNQQIVEKSGTEGSFLLNYLLQRYETNDLILLCSQLLQKVHDKTT